MLGQIGKISTKMKIWKDKLPVGEENYYYYDLNCGGFWSLEFVFPDRSAI